VLSKVIREAKKSIIILRFPVTEAETTSIIQSLKLKNSTRYDKVSGRILRHCAFEISKLFSYICNSSLQYGIYPERLKYPVVKPINRVIKQK
jgi:putative lipase involved disintegration of autophagic bodies